MVAYLTDDRKMGLKTKLLIDLKIIACSTIWADNLLQLIVYLKLNKCPKFQVQDSLNAVSFKRPVKTYNHLEKIATRPLQAKKKRKNKDENFLWNRSHKNLNYR